MDGETTVRTGEAYVSGALTALEDGARMRLFYELLAEVVETVGLRAYLPHRVSDPVAAAHLDPRTVYDIDRAHVTGARVVVAYAGIPSFGVGIEVELAREHGVPVVLVVERERTVSRLLLGNPAVVDVVRFTDLDGLRRGLATALERIAQTVPGAERPAVSDAVATGRLFGAGLRDLVGRYALRGAELGAFVLRDVLERPLADTARLLGLDTRAARRRLESARSRIGLASDAKGADVAQWLVTELIAPPARALQLHLFAGGHEVA